MSQEKERVCAQCNGKGKETCYYCQGSGITSTTMVINDAPQEVPIPCQRCGGTGHVQCNRCNGRGRI